MEMFVYVLLAIAITPSAMTDTTENVFKSHGIVPDVLLQAPNQLLKVTYDNKLEVKEGNELTPTQVKNQPSVDWQTEPNALYTLIMTDPDAPSRAEPRNREFKHWLVVNIPGNDISKGESLTGYIGSGPPKDTGLHRYIFLVYKQPSQLDVSQEPHVPSTSRKDRARFRAANFAVKFNLGNPVAGNFYQAQFDDYVPILHKQLSDN